MNNKKLFRNYAKIRNMPQAYADTALTFFHTLNDRDKALMIKEFKDYIKGVKSGMIIPSPVPIPKARRI